MCLYFGRVNVFIHKYLCSNLELHHHNRQKINVSQSHWMDVTLFFVGLVNRSVIKPVRGSSYSFKPWCNWCSRSGVGRRGSWRSHESTPDLSKFGANLTKTIHFVTKLYVAGKDSSPMCLIAMSCIIICLGIVT